MSGVYRFMSGLVGLDLSPVSRIIVRWLPYLRRAGVERLYLLYVIPSSLIDHPAGGILVDKIIEDETRRAREAFTAFAKELRAAGFTVEYPSEPPVGEPGPEIVYYARRVGADFIVIGGRGHSWLREILLGSTVEEVVRLADRPVFVVRERSAGVEKKLRVPPDPFSSTVVVAVDVGEEEASDVVECASALLAKTSPPRVILLYVDEHGLGGEGEKALRAYAEKLSSRLSDVPVEPLFIGQGSPSSRILAVAGEHHASLLIIGSHGGGKAGLRGLLLGSTADSIVRHAETTVLVCKRGREG